jgi:hypothetical protein
MSYKWEMMKLVRVLQLQYLSQIKQGLVIVKSRKYNGNLISVRIMFCEWCHLCTGGLQVLRTILTQVFNCLYFFKVFFTKISYLCFTANSINIYVTL